MRLNLHSRKFLLIFLVFGIVSLSCSLPLFRSQSSTVDESNPLPTFAIEETQVQQSIETVVAQPVEQFYYQISEAQLTSMLIDSLDSRADLGITDPRAYLRNGVVEIRGQAQRSGIKLPLLIQLQLYIDSQHQLQYEIVTAKIGPFPLPDILLDQLSNYLDQSLSNNLSLDRNDVYFEHVAVENGILVVSGHLR